MRTFRHFVIPGIAALALGAGCAHQHKVGAYGGESQNSSVSRASGNPMPARAASRANLTANDNPTSRDGRGAPSLDDFLRPAAWIYVDGHAGRFGDFEDVPQIQWVIDESVGASPSFRVEVYEPLLGSPKQFACTLETIDSSDDSFVAYAISAGNGSFAVGKDYSLLNPGDGFVIRNRVTGDEVKQIAPLPPGVYVIAAGIKNTAGGKEGLAISYFTVRDWGG